MQPLKKYSNVLEMLLHIFTKDQYVIKVTKSKIQTFQNFID